MLIGGAMKVLLGLRNVDSSWELMDGLMALTLDIASGVGVDLTCKEAT